MRNPQQDLEICSRATKGPWEVGKHHKLITEPSHYAISQSGEMYDHARVFAAEDGGEGKANAHLMAMSREALPHYIGLLTQIAAMAKLPENRRAYTQWQACAFMDQLVRLIADGDGNG